MNDKMTEELIDRLRAMYVANGTNYVQAAADKLEAQAERIKFLEADRNLEKKMRKDADEYADTLRAQLAEINDKRTNAGNHQVAQRT